MLRYTNANMRAPLDECFSILKVDHGKPLGKPLGFFYKISREKTAFIIIIIGLLLKFSETLSSTTQDASSIVFYAD